MKIINLFTLYIILFISPLISNAGWVIITTTKGSDGKEKQETLYIQNNKMKSVSEYTMIYDMNTSELTMMDNANKKYWKGTTKDYKNGIVEMMKTRIAEEIKTLPETKRDFAERMYNEALDKFISGEGNDTVKVTTQVRKISEKITIAGYPAQKYEVWVNNFKKVDMWISEKINISSDFDYTAFAKFMKQLTNSRSDLAYQSSPEYIALLNKGFALKSFDADNSQTRETVSIEKKLLSDSDFAVPGDYIQSPLSDMLKDQNKSQ